MRDPNSYSTSAIMSVYAHWIPAIIADKLQDHWVANHTRDALIAARGQAGPGNESSKPIMLIDENGVDHGFCISKSSKTCRTMILTVPGHSESIAEKVEVWIDDMIESQT